MAKSTDQLGFVLGERQGVDAAYSEVAFVFDGVVKPVATAVDVAVDIEGWMSSVTCVAEINCSG